MENKIQGYLAFAAVLVFGLIVLVRLFMLKKQGIKGMLFGKIRKKDYWLAPFAFFYIYRLFAYAFPTVLLHMEYRLPILESEISAIGWIGVNFCVLGLLLFVFALVSMGKSFRIGIDKQAQGELVTKGIFVMSRNPIFLAIALLLCGVFLAHWDGYFLAYFLLYLLCARKQIRREEAALEELYGEDYKAYKKKTRRYI